MTAANPTNSAPQFFAGETLTGAAFNRYIGSFDFRSVATGNTDLGARITMRPDNGQGGRQGFIALENTAAGVSVSAFGLNAAGGFVGPSTLATVAFAGWNTLRYEIDFFDGAFNDVANIFLNNTLVSTINGWESFYAVNHPLDHTERCSCPDLAVPSERHGSPECPRLLHRQRQRTTGQP